MIRIILVLLSVSLGWNARAATTMDYTGASDGSFCVTGGLTVSSCGKFVAVYLDLTNSKMWAWDPKLQQFNRGAIGSQDPASNTGGQSLASLSAGPYYPAWSGFNVSGSSTDAFIANFGASAIPLSVSGFSTWNSVAGTTTWNPSDTSASNALSNGDLTVTKNSGNGSHSGTRGTTSIAAGTGAKVYYSGIMQATGTTCPSPISDQMIGFANSTASLSTYIGQNTNGVASYSNSSFDNFWLNGNTGNAATDGMVCYSRSIKSSAAFPAGKRCVKYTLTAIASSGFEVGIVNGSFSIYNNWVGADNNGFGQPQNAGVNNGNILKNGVAVATVAATPTAGDTGILCVDTVAQLAWWKQSGTGWWNGNSSYDPAAGSGGVDISSIGSTIYFAVSMYDMQGSAVITADFGPTIAGLPSGFCAFDAATCAGAGGSRGYIFGANDNFPPVRIERDRCRWAV